MPRSALVTDLAGFDLLLTVAGAGSIGQAAKLHGLSQPAASIRLRQLESRLGVTLLERSAQGTRLTTAGELVASWAQPVLDRAAELETSLEALRSGQRTQLRTAASLTIAEYLLPRWLIMLGNAHPEIRTSLMSGDSADVSARVQARRADIGFVEGPDVPDTLQARVVARDELVLVVAPSHRWARRRTPLTVEDIAATPLVSRGHGSDTRGAWERALRTPLADPALEVTSSTAIKAAVLSGLAPAVLSSYAVATELAVGTLIRVRTPDGLDLSRRLRAVWPRGETPRGPAADLLTFASRSTT
jgi:DNA-binding transcriptional LysR family regulator